MQALYNAYRARRTEREHPPAGRFVEVGGVRLHYLEKGEGPPVVLLHGNVVTDLTISSAVLTGFPANGILYANADLGATARDNSGIATVRTYQGGSEVTTPRIDTSKPGSYVIEYRATDPSGNLATSSRTVIVRAANDNTTAATTTSAVVGE